MKLKNPSKHPETYRQCQVRILKLAEAVTLEDLHQARKINLGNYHNARCARYLVKSGHVDGDEEILIEPFEWHIFGLTTSGYQLLQELEQKEHEDTWWRKWLLKPAANASVFIVTALVAAIIGAKSPESFDWIFNKLFHRHASPPNVTAENPLDHPSHKQGNAINDVDDNSDGERNHNRPAE